MTKRTAVVIGLVFLSLVACTGSSSPVGTVVGVSEFGGFLHVLKTGPNGSFVICSWHNNLSPGSHFRPQGCEELPAQ